MHRLKNATTREELLHAIEWFGYGDDSTWEYHYLDTFVTNHPNIRFSVRQICDDLTKVNVHMVDRLLGKLADIPPGVLGDNPDNWVREVSIPTAQYDKDSNRPIKYNIPYVHHTLLTTSYFPNEFNVPIVNMQISDGGIPSLIIPTATIYMEINILIEAIDN